MTGTPGGLQLLRQRVLTPFDRRPPTEQVANALIGPIVLGLVCGVTLRHSTAGYLVLQLVAVAGGCSGGYEHRTARAGAVRGTVGGLLLGAYVLAGYVLAGGRVGHTASPFVPAVDAVVGAALGATFGALRRRHDRLGGAPAGG